MSENSASAYERIKIELDIVQRQLLDLEHQRVDARVKRGLAALAKVKEKPRYVRTLETQLSQELGTHRRMSKLDILLEMIEEADEVRKHIVW